MIAILQAIFGGIALLGAIAASLSKSSYDKLIGIGLLTGGVIPFVAARGYLDVAIAVSLLVPVTTIIILQVTGPEEER
ncbi:MAG: EhaD family protein [Methanomicrobiaceae archaeon]|nr:EhaD family protein [Methanomicrobiaceae archaeon]MDD5419496.1 EhaD family protein [Methanomicrobiaceae archaeon]